MQDLQNRYFRFLSMSHQPTKDAKVMPSNRYTSRNSTNSRRWTFIVVLTLSLVFAFSSSLYSRDYALCSRSNDIYTVDEAQPRVECIVVRRSRILDTGKQGQYAIVL